MQRKTIQLLSISLFVGLLGWGLWTFLVYLGVPVHTGVLTSSDFQESLTSLCNNTSFFCRGAYSVFGFISHTLSRIPVFVWYTLCCAVLFVIVLGWNVLRRGSLTLEWTMTPWKLLLLFVGSCWLLFTCISLSHMGAVPMRTLVEPKPEVYQGAGPEAIAALQKNYTALKEKGCLTYQGVFGNVAEASQLSMVCIQGSFFTRVLPPLFAVLVLLLELLVAGRYVLRKAIRLRSDSLFTEFAMSLGVGTAAVIVLLWIGAAFHIYTALFGWLLILAIPLIGFKDTVYWVEKFLSSKWQCSYKWHSALLIACWFLLSYLALNYLNVIRPFPIGWDDLGSYLNRPRLLVSYGKFVHSMASFQWEFLTSLGFLLFGFESVFGATVGLVINWFQGVFAIIVIILFGRTFLGEKSGVLAAALYYCLPLVGHFSFADMKIDNAVFAVGALATFALFYGLFLSQEERTAQLKWLFVAGLFGGLAFGMKFTGIMVIMMLGAVVLGVSMYPTAFFGVSTLAFAVFVKQGVLNVPTLMRRLGGDSGSPQIFFVLCIALGVMGIGFAAWKRSQAVRSTVISTLVLVAGISAMTLPWVLHNNILHRDVLGLHLKAPNDLTPIVDHFGNRPEAAYRLGPDLAVDKNHERCISTAGAEELDRYWGNAIGWGHYIKLPWRAVMNIDHAGYYVTMHPSLLLFPLLLLLPYFWKRGSRWIRWLWISTVFLLVQWAILANGVPWYGIGMFLGLVLCLEALISKAPDVLSKTATSVFITLSLLICLGMRMWQFESQINLFEYAIGKVSAETLRERTIPHYDDITDIVMRRHETMPDRPLLYRIGTFMPYFIPKNKEVIGATDHQLDFFNCLHQDRDATKTLARLKALGFNSIVFDTNTATIERNPNGTLHQKVQALTDFLNSPEAGLDVVIYDPSAGIAFLLIP